MELMVQFIIELPIFITLGHNYWTTVTATHSKCPLVSLRALSWGPSFSCCILMTCLNITSTFRLYADDTVVYRIIHLTYDIQKLLQEDLNTLHNGLKIS